MFRIEVFLTEMLEKVQRAELLLDKEVIRPKKSNEK